MANTMLYGNKVKQTILDEVKLQIETSGYVPKNIIIQVGNNTASNVYVGNKLNAAIQCNISMEHIKFPEEITMDQLLKVIQRYNEDNTVDGMLVQLPLPAHIDECVIADAILPRKDVDGFGKYSQGGTVVNSSSTHRPCTPKGIMRLLEFYEETVEGKDVVIVGRSNIVGKPLAAMMTQAGATVTLCHTKTKSLQEKTKAADIVVLATGQLKKFNSEYFTNGQLIIDVGIGRDENGKLCGDLDLEEVNTTMDMMRIVPSPGGCGQTTVACLMQNIVESRKMV